MDRYIEHTELVYKLCCKMKHSRNEVVRHIVNSYMKRRQYIDNENAKKYDQPLVRTRESSAISSLVDIESSCPNSITYKCVQNDPSVVEAQFNALKIWINESAAQKTSDELKAILFPMLCHLYIEMLNGGHKSEASAFLRKNQHLSPEDGMALLEELATIENAKEISEKRIVSCLRSSKCEAKLSSESIQLLKQYLIKKSHVIILQIINLWFDLEEDLPCDEYLLDLREDSDNSQNGFGDARTLMGGDNADLAKIDDIIRSVNNGPASSAPLAVYSITNYDQSLACGRISGDIPLLAAGYRTAQICLWSLTDDPLTARKPNCGTTIRCAADPVLEWEDRYEPLNDESCVELRGHSGEVQDVAFISQSKLMMSISRDKTMRAWNLENYECVCIYRGHNYPMWCVEASPLTGYVATGSQDRTARLWSMELNYPLRIFAGHSQDVDCLRFHPNGNYLASGSSDHTVRLWSVDTGELVRVLDGHRSAIMALAFNPNGIHLASAGDDKRIKVWDIRSSSVIGEFRGFSDTVVSLDWCPNGDYIAACCYDNTVKICPLKNILNDTEPSPTKFYHIPGNCMCSIKYSHQNRTPMCVVGVRSNNITKSETCMD